MNTFNPPADAKDRARELTAKIGDSRLNDALHKALLETSKMEPTDALAVLEGYAKDSKLNKPEHIRAILLTTEFSLAASDAKQNYIYQTLLERDNLSTKDIDVIAHFGLKKQKLNTSEAMLAESVLAKPKIAKETAEYINDFFIDKLDNNNAYKGRLISMLMKHYEFGFYDQLEQKANGLTGDARKFFEQDQKIAKTAHHSQPAPNPVLQDISRSR